MSTLSRASASPTTRSLDWPRLSRRRVERLFAVLIATLMVPEQVTFIPLFAIYRQLGWINSYLPLTVPAFFGNAFLIFLFRQYVMTIPRDLDEAARIDGCGTWGVFYRVLLP